MTEHRLSQYRTPARVALDDDGRPTHGEIVLRDGDTVRLDTPAECRRLRRCLEACEDMLRQGRRG